MGNPNIRLMFLGLLTTVEVADRLGLERSTLSRWVQLGHLEVAMRLPGRTGGMLFDPVAIDALVADLAALKAAS